MSIDERVEDLIYNVIRDIAPSFIKTPDRSKQNEVPILGRFDSLAMVDLVMGLEDALAKEFGRDIALLNQMSAQGTQIFKDINSLKAYIKSQI